MEFKPIPALNVTLPPGTKLLITGPVKISKNVMLLGPNNVEVLGGEVDNLLVEYAYENVLLKALGKPINSNPKHHYDEEMTIANFPNNPAISSGRAMVPRDLGYPNSTTMRAPNQVTQNLFNEPIPQELFDDDDDEFLNLNLNQIEQSTGSNKRPSTRSSNTNASTKVISVSNSSSPAQSIISPLAGPSTSHTSEPPAKVFLHDDMHEDEEIDFDALEALETLSKDLYKSAGGNVNLNEPKPPVPVTETKRVEPDSPEYKYKIEGCNVLTIEQLNRIPSARWKSKVFIFFPLNKSIKKKLQIIKDVWTISVEFDDGTEEKLEVDFCSDLLEKLIGYSALEMKLMRAEYKKTLGLQEKITDALSGFTKLLHVKEKLWKISFAQQVPKVIGLVDIKPVYKKILLNKVETENVSYFRERLSN